MSRADDGADGRESALPHHVCSPASDMLAQLVYERRIAVLLQVARAGVGGTNEDVEAFVRALGYFNKRLEGVGTQEGVHRDRVT